MSKKYKPSAKQIAKRQNLIELSKKAKAAMELNDPRLIDCDTSTVNNVVMFLFYPSGTYKTFNDWKKQGMIVKKDESAYSVWSKPKKLTKKVEDVKTGDEIEKQYSAFCIASLFHESQVQKV